jgi:transposase-like protein
MMAKRRRSKHQHYLLSAAARTLSLVEVLTLSEAEAEARFAAIRWAASGGQPECPHCGCGRCYDCRRRSGAPRWRCKACRQDFSLTSGTLFAYHKLPLGRHLAAIAIFVNEVKGKAALALSRDLDVQYKTAFVLTHKLREAMAAAVKACRLGGAGRVAEIDGAWFGGHVRPENRRTDRKDRRRKENQSGKRQSVVVIRERGGRTKTKAFKNEEDGVAFIKANLDRGTVLHADEAPAWNILHGHFETWRVNHQDCYMGDDGACTNGAESYFSRLRRAEAGHHHHLSGPYLGRYAQEMAFREDHRRADTGSQFRRVVELVAATGPSVDFCGYWQRHRAARSVGQPP